MVLLLCIKMAKLTSGTVFLFSIYAITLVILVVVFIWSGALLMLVFCLFTGILILVVSIRCAIINSNQFLSRCWLKIIRFYLVTFSDQHSIWYPNFIIHYSRRVKWLYSLLFRGAYCAVVVARLTNVYTKDMFSGTADWLQRLLISISFLMTSCLMGVWLIF